MASNGSIFFAGVGTTFLILGAGLGSGLFMANSALKQPGGYHARAREDVPAPNRVVLPSSAEAAEGKPVVQKAEQPVAPTPLVQAALKEAQAIPELVEKPDAKKAESDKRKRRQAERKERRLAIKQDNRRPVSEAPVLAFGGDESRPSNGNFNLFGN